MDAMNNLSQRQNPTNAAWNTMENTMKSTVKKTMNGMNSQKNLFLMNVNHQNYFPSASHRMNLNCSTGVKMMSLTNASRQTSFYAARRALLMLLQHISENTTA
jgi:hypothetical protein